MGADAALELLESLVYTATGRHLNDLQRVILQQVWQGQKYSEIAIQLGYTEGHVKDVASDLWRRLSQVLGEKVTKATLKSALERQPTPPSPSPQAAGTLLGREDAIATLNHFIASGSRAIVIQGEGGIGKTTLAQHYLSHHPFDQVLELPMAREAADIISVEGVLEEWLRQDFGVEPGREFGVTLDRLRRQLQRSRVGVLIDNLEPALDGAGRFIPSHRRYRELLRVLLDHRTPTVTLITSRDRLCEPGLSVVHYRLPSLAPHHWATFFHQLSVDRDILQAMHTAYGGNAKAMEILRGVMQADYGGDMAAYWQAQGQDLLGPVDLKNLVGSQVNRLQALDLDAYRIYCRLGVYRYQQVSTIPGAAITALMADLPSERHTAIITSLRNRSLLEQAKDSYWLHPVVRADAIARLRASADWETANRWAAQFWTNQVQRILTRDDAIQALEAYYHCIAIGDYDAASGVILHSRDNQWGQFLPLGSTLYRMGLIQPVLEASRTLVAQIPPHRSEASELYSILGDLLWITGQIAAAIDCQEQTLAIARHCLDQTTSQASHRHYYLTMLAVDAQLSLGLYHLDLWELDTATTHFETVIQQTAHSAHHRWAEKAMACQSLALAHQGHYQAARQLAAAIYPALTHQQPSGRNAFFVQILGQTFCLLGNDELAETLLQSAAAAAQSGHLIQIQANALVGLGQIARRRDDGATSVASLLQAITLLEDLGAQCDLAEAHYQLGLTYQRQANAQAQEHFEQAIAYFRTMQAPQRIARVRQAATTPQESSAP